MQSINKVTNSHIDTSALLHAKQYYIYTYIPTSDTLTAHIYTYARARIHCRHISSWEGVRCRRVFLLRSQICLFNCIGCRHMAQFVLHQPVWSAATCNPRPPLCSMYPWQRVHRLFAVVLEPRLRFPTGGSIQFNCIVHHFVHRSNRQGITFLLSSEAGTLGSWWKNT